MECYYENCKVETEWTYVTKNRSLQKYTKFKESRHQLSKHQLLHDRL